jgi:hypothetical protein
MTERIIASTETQFLGHCGQLETNRTYVVGIAAVAATAAYSLSVWHGASDDGGEQASTTEQRNPTAD